MSIGRLDNQTRSVTEHEAPLRRELGAFDATSVVVGTVIGSAIFLIPSSIATDIGSAKAVFLIWIGGGVLTLFGALSLAELGAIYPRAGGIYVYLKEAYGPLPAFLYGWGLLAIIHSGSIAAIAVSLSLYLGHSLSLGDMGHKALTSCCIVLLTAANCLGIRLSKMIQNTLFVLKLGGIAAMSAALLAHGIKTGLLEASLRVPLTVTSWTPVGAGLVAVLWAYEGWHVVSFTAGEMKRPQINLPRSLAIGTMIVTAVYLVTNAAYYSTLTPTELRSNPAVAAAAMTKSFGSSASQFITLLVSVSIVGSLNGMVITGPRVYYAMAKDGVLFRVFGKTNARYNTPTFALAAQGLWATVLSWSGTYRQLFTDVIFAAWLFYGLTVAAVIVLRKTKPHLNRPFLVPAFPWVPILFCAAAMGIVVSTILKSPTRSLVGIALLMTGVPLFLLFRWRSDATKK
jgi:APA family basic amino acid/polyamine antiporter